jgi:hypothetical protein
MVTCVPSTAPHSVSCLKASLYRKSWDRVHTCTKGGGGRAGGRGQGQAVSRWRGQRKAARLGAAGAGLLLAQKPNDAVRARPGTKQES